MPDLDELEALAAKLREEASVLSWRSLEHGSADAGISSNLADEAAAGIDALIARVRAAEGALAGIEHLSLVIESAVRNVDAMNHRPVVAAIKAVRAALPTPPGPVDGVGNHDEKALLPCPFCGSADKPKLVLRVHLDVPGYHVVCNAAGFGHEPGRGCGAESGWGETGAEAIAAWNRRVQPDRAAQDVLAERRRQVEAEGWTPEHDDQHDSGELAAAAACYAVGRKIMEGGPTHFDHITHLWPWSPDWWKPSDARRNRVKAAALLIADIERIDRAAIRALPTPPEPLT